MAITLRHDAASFGGSRGGGSNRGRKYDLAIQQQQLAQNNANRAQDRMFQFGMQERGAMLRDLGNQQQARRQEDIMRLDAGLREEGRVADFDRNVQQTRINRDEDRMDRAQGRMFDRDEWDRRRGLNMDDEATARNRLARINRATQRGDLEFGIENGEFDDRTAKSLRETFDAEEAIVSSNEMDDVQKDEALAKIMARRLRLAQNRIDRQTRPPQNAREAFDANPDMYKEYLGMAQQQAMQNYKLGTEAYEADPENNPLPTPPTFESTLNLAGEMWDARQRFGMQQQAIPPIGQGGSPAQPAPPVSQAQPQVDPPTSPPTAEVSRELPKAPQLDWDTAIASKPNEIDRVRLRRAKAYVDQASPEIKNAVEILLSTSSSREDKVKATKVLRIDNNISLADIMETPEPNTTNSSTKEDRRWTAGIK